MKGNKTYWGRALFAIILGAGVPLAGVLGLPALAVSVTGCGPNTMTVYYKSAGTALAAQKTCYRVLRTVDEKRQEQYADLLGHDDTDGANSLKLKWLGNDYPKALKACDAIGALADEALAAGPTVEAAKDKDKDAAGWIARLTALGAETVRILGELGISFPGVK